MGIEVDTKSHEIRLPADKLLKVNQLLQSFMKKSKVTLKDLQSLVGYHNFAYTVATPGRSFLRRIIHFKNIRRPWHRIRLNTEAKRDLQAGYIYLIILMVALSFLRIGG